MNGFMKADGLRLGRVRGKLEYFPAPRRNHLQSRLVEAHKVMAEIGLASSREGRGPDGAGTYIREDWEVARHGSSR